MLNLSGEGVRLIEVDSAGVGFIDGTPLVIPEAIPDDLRGSPSVDRQVCLYALMYLCMYLCMD